MLENIPNAHDIIDCQNILPLSTNVLEFLITRDLLLPQYKESLFDQRTQQLTNQAQGPSPPNVNQGSGAGLDPFTDFLE